MIDPRLKHVVAAARRGSFRAAAQSIGVTQSAVTKSIGKLERQVGYSIFHPTSRAAVLTERSRDFVVPRDGVEVDDLLLPRPDGHEASP